MTPIQKMVDAACKPVKSNPNAGSSGLPYVTYEGVLEIGDKKLRCYILSNGMRIFDAEDVDKFFNIEKPEK